MIVEATDEGTVRGIAQPSFCVVLQNKDPTWYRVVEEYLARSLEDRRVRKGSKQF